YPEDRGRLLWSADQGHAEQEADPFAGPPAPGGDGDGQGTDRAQPARDRRRVRGPRPHHRAARLPPGPQTDGDRRQAARGLGKADPQAERVGSAARLLNNVGQAVDNPGAETGLESCPQVAPDTRTGLYTWF